MKILLSALAGGIGLMLAMSSGGTKQSSAQAINTTTPITGVLPYVARINMLGCKVVKTVNVGVGKNVLFYNAGTVVRRAHSLQAPMPQWGIKPGSWFEVKGAGKVKIVVKVSHTGCAYTDVYTVNVS